MGVIQSGHQNLRRLLAKFAGHITQADFPGVFARRWIVRRCLHFQIHVPRPDARTGLQVLGTVRYRLEQEGPRHPLAALHAGLEGRLAGFIVGPVCPLHLQVQDFAFRIGMAGIQPQRLLQIGQRRGMVILLCPADIAAIVQRLGIAGMEIDGLTIAFHRLIETLQVAQDVAAAVPGDRVAGRESQHAVETGQGLLKACQVAQCQAAIAPGLRGLRLQRQGAFKAVQGLGRALQIPQRHAAIGEQFGVLDARGHHAVEGRQGIARALELQQRQAEIVPGAGIVRGNPQRLAQKVRRFAAAALLQPEQAHIVTRPEQFRVGIAYLQIQLFSPRQIALLVDADGLLSQGFEVHSAGLSPALRQRPVAARRRASAATSAHRRLPCGA